MTEATSLAATDVLYAIVDPPGTPGDSKITAGNAGASLAPARGCLLYTGSAVTGANYTSETTNPLDAEIYDTAQAFSLPILLSTGDYFEARATVGTVTRVDLNQDGTWFGLWLLGAGVPKSQLCISMRRLCATGL